jgi:hypothetical protein
MKKISLKNFMTALFCLFMANSLSAQIVIDFESPATSTNYNGFGGAFVNIIANPDPSGINTSATVAELNETPGSLGFAGAFSNPIALPAIDFVTYATVCVKVWAPNTGDMLFKAEGQSAGATWEQLQPINVANTWVELCFDGTQPDAAGSGQNAIGRTFTVSTVFFDFNPPVPPAVLTTWYFDDILMKDLNPVLPPPPPSASAYCATQVTHFAGNPPSAIFLTIANIDATTMYVEIESVNGADPVDFLGVDGGSGANISGQNTSTPGKISRTLTWTNPPTNVILNVLWSQVSFGGNWQLSQAPIMVPFAATCPLPPPAPAPNPVYCQSIVSQLGNPAEIASQVLLSISKVNANSMKVEIESANNDPVDFLLVTGGSGASISAENTSVPGKISRILTWNNTPPSEVNLNVIWSKASFGGNWQLSSSDVTVDFDSKCSTAIPTMGEWAMFLFALIMLTMGVVFVLGMQTEVQMATTARVNVPVRFRRMPFDKVEFIKAMRHTLGLAVVGFAAIFLIWGEIVFADLIGMSLTIPVVAYLIHLLKK